jgi:pimeloyl-ACP methyl ester carboxylesterase
MTLAHDVSGDGPVVLLLHSFVCDRRMWDPQVPALVAAGFRVLRCDMRGFGDSPMPDAPYNDADDVAALLAEVRGSGPLAVVAASGGGQVAQELAARRPGVVSTLVLLCSATRDHERGPELRAFGERENALMEAGDIDAMTELNVDMWLGPEAGEQTRAALRTMQRHAFEVQMAVPEVPEAIAHDYDLAKLGARTLLVSGAHDAPDFRRIADRLAGILPDATRLDLEWAGHLPSMERPDLMNPVIVDFLATS